MNALTLIHQDVQSSAKPAATDRCALKTAQTLGAIIGLWGSVMVAVLGSFLTAAGWFTTSPVAKHWPTTAGTVLLCSTIPLIVLGACCLDWMEKDLTQSRSNIASKDDEDKL